MKKKVSSERSAMCTEHTIDCCFYLVENGKVIGKFSFTFFLFSRKLRDQISKCFLIYILCGKIFLKCLMTLLLAPWKIVS